MKVEDEEEDLYAMVCLCFETKLTGLGRLWLFTPPVSILQIYGEDAPIAPARAAPPEPVKQEHAQFQDAYAQPATGMQCFCRVKLQLLTFPEGTWLDFRGGAVSL